MARYVRVYPYTKASIEISYRFVCEHCRKDSGFKTYKETGPQAGGTPVEEGKNVTMRDVETLRWDAKNLLEKKINKYRVSVEKGEYPEIFDGTCPHCKKSQSWDGTGSIKNLYLYPFWGLSFALLVFFIMLIVSWFSNWRIDIFRPTLIASAVGALFGLVLGLICVIKVKWDTKNVTQKNKPQIFWPDINDASITQ
jgi:hypothetical protein